jgi:hypothetical protein
MTIQSETVIRLQRLLDLYRDGYESAVVDQTVGKLISLEARQCHAELQRLAVRLAEYEKRHGISSAEFYRRFRAGTMGDDMDFVEWSVFWDMHQATQKHLDDLVKQAP